MLMMCFDGINRLILSKGTCAQLSKWAQVDPERDFILKPVSKPYPRSGQCLWGRNFFIPFGHTNLVLISKPVTGQGSMKRSWRPSPVVTSSVTHVSFWEVSKALLTWSCLSSHIVHFKSIHLLMVKLYHSW